MELQHTHKETFEDGLAIRKEVLGAAHVERSLANASDFATPMQELVTEYCWGAVWSRDGLERKTRSMLNLAMLTALNRGHELSVHVKGAINNGVTPEEIQEVLMQTAIYVGVPAALESFRIAEATLKEMNVTV
ncbi:4-carboxymuconolactone decarboxylase [Arthrobacter sp. LAR12-1-1.1]|uniref:4-carboxymuconolactone decarboxylase n=1 Tax=Arthrobacter sp. LAR12-1-1.1 TaxID=3135215 RepID=UPI0034227CD9